MSNKFSVVSLVLVLTVFVAVAIKKRTVKDLKLFSGEEFLPPIDTTLTVGDPGGYRACFDFFWPLVGSNRG